MSTVPVVLQRRRWRFALKKWRRRRRRCETLSFFFFFFQFGKWAAVCVDSWQGPRHSNQQKNLFSLLPGKKRSKFGGEIYSSLVLLLCSTYIPIVGGGEWGGNGTCGCAQESHVFSSSACQQGGGGEGRRGEGRRRQSLKVIQNLGMSHLALISPRPPPLFFNPQHPSCLQHNVHKF